MSFISYSVVTKFGSLCDRLCTGYTCTWDGEDAEYVLPKSLYRKNTFNKPVYIKMKA